MKSVDLMKAKVVFIGAGNMAEALINGLIVQQVCATERLLVTDLQPERLTYFQTKYGVAGSSDNATAVCDADIVVLAVKPQHMVDVLNSVKDNVNKDRILFISIAAGVTCNRIEDVLGGDVRVARVMPNTPALIGAGAAAVCGGRWAVEDDLDVTEALLEAVGSVVRVDETDMDAVTAVSGSGPAYVFFIIEAMEKAAAQMNLAPEIARKLILGTITGAARLCGETGEDAGVLRERVTSKGGTTAAALQVLNDKKVSDIWVEALLAARTRSKELSAG